MSEANVTGPRSLSQLLRMAVITGVESAVQVHIDRGDDLNARDASGMTPLMLSAARNKPAICRLLLSAGADHRLLDPSGKTAFEIAVAAGSNDTASILDDVHTSSSGLPTAEAELGAAPEYWSVDSSFAPKVTSDVELKAPTTLPGSTASGAFSLIDNDEFDLSGWETEDVAEPPEVDLIVLGSAHAIQTAITAHEPIDSSVEWDDIEAYLPEQASPLARVGDAEGRSRLRLLLLRAIREGSVPALDVQMLSINDDRSANLEAEAFLTMIVNDLGAEVDDRFEYVTANENFQIFVNPEETPDEEAVLDQALNAIDSAASPRQEPLRIYQREFQRQQLLTAEQEVELAQEMEEALEAALDALATWPEGIAKAIAAGAEAMTGTRTLSSVWLGDAEPDPEATSIDSQEIDSSETAIDEEAIDEEATDEEGELATSAEADNTGFANVFHQLKVLVERGDTQLPPIREIRHALAALRLNRRFLLELSDAAADRSAPCPDFGRALNAFRRARDRMTAANLKLAFFHARKYLYSEEPLDDLAQEANIGLLEAVDRYDWRRGYKFSTYATWWIRQRIGRYVADKARLIRVPVHAYEKMQRVERVATAFEKTFGREPTVNELAERTMIPADKVAALLRIVPEPSPIDELSIDEMIAIDAPRSSFVLPDPMEVVELAELRGEIDRLLSSLSDKDDKAESVLRLRFGIGGDEGLTLDQIGQRFSVTRERIRQIEDKALRKLRHPARIEAFAHLALGIKPSLNQLNPVGHKSEVTNLPNAAEQIAESAERGQARPLRTRRGQAQASNSAQSSSLDRILAHAAELGVQVEDDRTGSSGHLWVNLLEMPENGHRKLARKLLESGFTFWSGKGYWR